MLEIQSKNIAVKSNDGHMDKYYLIHDGIEVIEFGMPGSRATVPGEFTMLVGNRQELDEQILLLGLKNPVGEK